MKSTIDCSFKLGVEIEFSRPDGSTHTSFPSFGTGEKIEGTIAVISRGDLHVDNLWISFIGQQSTSIPSAVPDTAQHIFLNVTQPIEDSPLPNPKVLKAGQKYEFPFSFGVVDYLPSSACPHSTHPLVKAVHLHPPPSCGRATISGFGGKLRDDFAPPACKIVYYIQVRLERPSLVSGKQETILEKRFDVRIKSTAGDIPLPELPAPTISDDYIYHQDQRSKSPAGQLAVSLDEPDCFWLPLRDTTSLISKAVRLSLVYSPESPSPTPPPEIKSLRGQIIATTLYTTTLDETHPLVKKKNFFGRPLNFLDAESPIPLSSIPRLHWTQEQPGAPYTATLLVPVTLTHDRTFIPTFHSCLIARTYSLAFQLSVHGVSSPFRLRVPMQIAARRDPEVLPSYNASLGVIDVE